MQKKERRDDNPVQQNRELLEWHCDTYCRKIRHVTCEGKDHINDNAPDLCPYFDEMLY